MGSRSDCQLVTFLPLRRLSYNLLHSLVFQLFARIMFSQYSIVVCITPLHFERLCFTSDHYQTLLSLWALLQNLEKLLPFETIVTLSSATLRFDHFFELFLVFLSPAKVPRL